MEKEEEKTQTSHEFEIGNFNSSDIESVAWEEYKIRRYSTRTNVYQLEKRISHIIPLCVCVLFIRIHTSRLSSARREEKNWSRIYENETSADRIAQVSSLFHHYTCVLVVTGWCWVCIFFFRDHHLLGAEEKRKARDHRARRCPKRAAFPLRTTLEQKHANLYLFLV